MNDPNTPPHGSTPPGRPVGLGFPRVSLRQGDANNVGVKLESLLRDAAAAQDGYESSDGDVDPPSSPSSAGPHPGSSGGTSTLAATAVANAAAKRSTSSSTLSTVAFSSAAAQQAQLESTLTWPPFPSQRTYTSETRRGADALGLYAIGRKVGTLSNHQVMLIFEAAAALAQREKENSQVPNRADVTEADLQRIRALKDEYEKAIKAAAAGSLPSALNLTQVTTTARSGSYTPSSPNPTSPVSVSPPASLGRSQGTQKHRAGMPHRSLTMLEEEDAELAQHLDRIALKELEEADENMPLGMHLQSTGDEMDQDGTTNEAEQPEKDEPFAQSNQNAPPPPTRSQEEKLKSIQEEFGPSNLSEDAKAELGEERYVSQLVFLRAYSQQLTNEPRIDHVERSRTRLLCCCAKCSSKAG